MSSTSPEYPQVGRGWAFPPRWTAVGVDTNDGAEHVT